MLRKHLAWVGALIAVTCTSFACADDRASRPLAADGQTTSPYHSIYVDTMTEPLARIREFFEETTVDTRGLTKKMSLGEFLRAIEAKTTGRNKLSISLDASGLGKDASRVAAAKVQCKGLSDKAKISMLVRYAVRIAADEIGSDLDCAIRKEGVVITWPRLATYTAVYNLPKTLGKMPLYISDSISIFPDREHKTKCDTFSDLSRILTTTISLPPWESVRLVNGTQLVVNASVERQEYFVDLLDQLRRLADRSLIMNARVIEVEKEFFDRHIAAMFAKNPAGGEPPEVVLVPAPLFKMLAERKPLIASDDVKLLRGRESVFLSEYWPVRTASGSGFTEPAVEGFAVRVCFQFTADARYIRLRLTRNIDRLVGMNKQQVEIPGQHRHAVETPNVKRSTASGKIQIPDSAPILMRCDYRPLCESSKQTVRLILARPYIWIGSEMAEGGVKSVSAESNAVWSAQIPGYVKSEIATESVPKNDAPKELVQALLSDILTNPELKGLRDFYGTPDSKKLVLDRRGVVAWQNGIKPDTNGFELVESKPEPFANRPRVLGVRLGQFEIEPTDLKDGSGIAEIAFFNAGGGGNGVVTGETFLQYSLLRVKNHWIVRLKHLCVP